MFDSHFLQNFTARQNFLQLCLLIFTIIFFCSDLYSGQTGVVTGKITDIESSAALENVNVYISNTTWGASTDKFGDYRIEQIPAGTHELVVAIVGYTYQSILIQVKPFTKLTKNFKLQPEIYQTEAIQVEAALPQKWFDDLEVFKSKFLGQSEYAAKCKIENAEVLNFEWQENRFFTAKAIAPLKVQNYALGYKVECVLTQFFWNKEYGKWSWQIKPHYTDLTPPDTKIAREWSKARQQAYERSVYHFLRSLREKKLNEDNYNLYFVRLPGEQVSRIDFRVTLVGYDALLSPGILPGEKKLHFENFINVVRDNYEISWLGLSSGEITIDEHGYPQESNAFEVYGFWAMLGVADLVPWYYEFNE